MVVNSLFVASHIAPLRFLHCRAFVAPVDIQAFTDEVKNKLSARCQGKTVKYFAQAVKEICLEYDELQKEKSSGLRSDADGSELCSDAPSVNGSEGNRLDIDLKDKTDAVIPNGEMKIGQISDSGAKLERCSNNQAEADHVDVEHAADDVSSSAISSERKNKISNGSQLKVLPAFDNPSLLKENASDDKKKGFTNGHNSKKVKSETTVKEKRGNLAATSKKDVKSSTSVDGPDIGKLVKERKSKKVSDGSPREFSPDLVKSDSDSGDGAAAQKMLKAKGKDDRRSTVADSKRGTGSNKRKALSGTGKVKMAKNEVVHPVKKSKTVDLKDDTGKASLSKGMKNEFSSPNSMHDHADEQSDLKRSSSYENTEMVLALGAQSRKSKVEPEVAGDEAELPSTKRRRRTLETMSNSAIDSDDRLGKDCHELKNVGIKPAVAQLPKRRRAICLVDDDDDEPKTPVHRGSARNVKEPSVSAISKSTTRDDSSRNAQKGTVSRYSTGSVINISKNMQSQVDAEFLLPDKLENEGRMPASNMASSPRNRDSEETSCKEAKSVSISPNKSPHLVSFNKPAAEQNKPTKSIVNKGPGTGPQKKVQSLSGKGSGVFSDGMKSSQPLVTSLRNKPGPALERGKTVVKAASRVNERAVLTETSVEHGSLPSEKYS